MAGRLKVALIGATDHANHFVPLISSLEPVDTVGVWDYDPDTAREFARTNGIQRIFDSPEEALEFAEAAVIPMHGRLPRKGERWGEAPSEHLRLSRSFLESGKAVFATRPFATKVSDAREMIRLAVNNNAPIMSCSALRYERGILSLRRRVRSGSLGKIKTWFPSVRTRFPDRPVTLGFYGVHGIEMSYSVIGTGAEWVQASAVPTDDEGRMTTVILAKFTDSRMMAAQLIDGSSKGAYKISVYGKDGFAEARPTTRYAAIPYKPWVKASMEGTRDNYFRIMFREFTRMVRSKVPAIPYDELLEVTKVLEASEKSVQTGRRVYLSDL